MRLLSITIMLLLTACANLKDDKGTTVVSGYSFGRDVARTRHLKASFSHPLTTFDIQIVQQYNSWLASFLVPGMTELELDETLSSASNVQGFLTGLAKVGGTLLSATEKLL